MNDPQRPTFVETIKAFTLAHPDYGRLHTDEEADVAEYLRHIEQHHQGADYRDGPNSDTWGTCRVCREPWPCAVWNEAEMEAAIHLGRAQDRVWASAQRHAPGLRVRPVKGR
jgi:hypothetical protein